MGLVCFSSPDEGEGTEAEGGDGCGFGDGIIIDFNVVPIE